MVGRTRIAPPTFVIKILISKFFENKILQNPSCETRAGQGFQRHPNKNSHTNPAVCKLVHSRRP
jgi:hypothetical protein